MQREGSWGNLALLNRLPPSPLRSDDGKGTNQHKESSETRRAMTVERDGEKETGKAMDR